MLSGNNSKPSILIIDDNHDILAFLQQVLRNSGYRSLTASSGKRALELLLEHESVDVVVVDYEMPSMNGYEVAMRIKEQRPEMPLILYTGFIDAVPAEKQKLFAGVVAKPSCVELLELIAATTQRIRNKPSG